MFEYLICLLSTSACFEIHILPKMTKITAVDRILIKNLRIEKQWSAKRMMKEFPNKA